MYVSIENVCKSIDESLTNRAEPTVVFIAGGSASGKTTIAEILHKKYPESVLISQDSYYIGRKYSEEHGFTFDQPESIGLDELREDVIKLTKAEKINEPVYSFIEDGGKRIGYKITEPAPLIIVEGLFVLNEKLAGCGGIKVFIKTGCHGRFIRRIIRDISRTCWEPRMILGYFLKVVDPMHQKYIDGQELVADFIISNEYDPIFETGNANCQKERQLKVEIEEPLPVKLLHSLGIEAISHTIQEDIYFSIPGTKKEEILRIRREGGNIFFTYKAPQEDGRVRIKSKVEFPLSLTEEEAIQVSCKEELKIVKTRDLFIWEGILFSQDCIVSEKSRYFLEIRTDDLEKAENILRRLGLVEPEILRESYFGILK